MNLAAALAPEGQLWELAVVLVDTTVGGDEGLWGCNDGQ